MYAAYWYALIPTPLIYRGTKIKIKNESELKSKNEKNIYKFLLLQVLFTSLSPQLFIQLSLHCVIDIAVRFMALRLPTRIRPRV